MIQAMAPASFGVGLTRLTCATRRDGARITVFARERNGGLIVTASQGSVIHRDLIISLASRYHLPNIQPFRYYPASGGLSPTA